MLIQGNILRTFANIMNCINEVNSQELDIFMKIDILP